MVLCAVQQSQCTDDGQNYRLQANEAAVNDILEAISLKTDIPVCLDTRNTSTLTIDSKRNTLEALIDDLATPEGTVTNDMTDSMLEMMSDIFQREE